VLACAVAGKGVWNKHDDAELMTVRVEVIEPDKMVEARRLG
jgi:hypothetical protein